jgi:glycosyltransferase involved in cell wall biosynthesis
LAWGLRYLRDLRRVLGEFRPHIVHLPIASAKAPMLRDRLFANAVKRCGARLVMHPHSGLFEERYQRADPGWKSFMGRFLRLADVIVCLSERWQRFFDSLELGVRTVVIPNPIDPGFQAEIDAVTPEPRDDRVVLFVGAVCEPKGVPELIDALEVLLDEMPDLRARIVGGKQYPGHFERLVARHAGMRHRERVDMTGPIFGADLAVEYRSADVFVLPSHFEAMPLVLVEAMVAGLPIVASQVGGIPDIVSEGENGLLVPPRDVPSLTAALRTLLNERELREAMGQRNRTEARQRYSAENFAAACNRLYDSVLEAGITTD